MKRALKIFKYALEFLFLLVVVYCIRNYKMVQYAVAQAKGQLTVAWNVKTIDEVLNDKTFPDSLKQRLELVKEIKQFCFDSLGLNHSENYSTVYDQHDKPILWNVTACEAFKLRPYEWTFPFLGKVPYKGFFKKESAEKEADELRAENLDVYLYSVSGWSTLGWFNDPILSNMLKRSEGSLADLIIHELTHGTLYVKSSANFNENLASFVGNRGALMFLERKYGKDSVPLKKYLRDKQDEDLFDEYCLDYSSRLDSLYRSNSRGKKYQKETIIRNFIEGVDSLVLFDKDRYKRFAESARKGKNAFFMSFVRYESQQEVFEKEFTEKFNSDIRKYIVYLKEKYPSL